MLRKALFIMLVATCAAASLVACSRSADSGPQDQAGGPQSQAEAYFAVLEALYEEDTGLNDYATYLALDLSRTRLADTAPLEALFQGFCGEHGCTLLLDTYEGLEGKGYIKDLSFENGFLVVFADVSLTEDELVTEATKWRSGLGAIGGKYTVKKGVTGWRVTDVTDQWIS